MDISISDVLNFQRCRRKWYFESPNLESLSKVGLPPSPLHLGTMVHRGLEAQSAGVDPIEFIKKWAQDKTDEWCLEYKEMVGTVWSLEEEERHIDALNITIGLLKHYFEYYGQTPFGDLELIATELPFKVKIPETDGSFVGTMDVLLEDPDGQVVIGDHKTYSHKKELKALEVDIQFMGYSWAAMKLFDNPVRGAIYDGLYKKLPTRLVPIKSGKRLGRLNQSLTTPKVLRECIEEHGFDEWEYEEYLTAMELRDKTDNPFFNRVEINYSPTTLNLFAKRLTQVYIDMKRAIRESSFYPNVPWMGCFDCSKQDMCHAMFFGEDWEWIKTHRYKKKLYGTFSSLQVEPHKVKNVQDVKRLVQEAAEAKKVKV